MQPPYPDFDLELRLLLEAIYVKYQHDFRQYAITTMRRRVAQAMQRLGCETVSRLQERVIHDPAVFSTLMSLLTVQVSEMFRDPPYFKAIRDQLIPVLETWPFLRVWVAGCAGGEELWSLAILFAEEGLADRTQFYATDINPEALREAERGIYPIDRIAAFSSNYLKAGGRGSLSDYYAIAYGGASFARQVPCQAVFADHSLATDGAFTEVHFVSCRNVMIYFDRPLQDRAVDLFKASLVHGGFLGLGAKETLRFSAHGADFEEVDRAQRLYRHNKTAIPLSHGAMA